MEAHQYATPIFSIDSDASPGRHMNPTASTPLTTPSFTSIAPVQSEDPAGTSSVTMSSPPDLLAVGRTGNDKTLMSGAYNRSASTTSRQTGPQGF
ncbi:hypothetical protein GN244_ATG20457 [Phytophthora infestans]|uniref:Uncharacterized protein n=1 Tax=Phytophthora infestans TaxID=4787 RepID=A0A833RMM7_PHYIN|nr:hypothetical protein GN244_ATG20457 [Phytophthora infestans]